ncbi:MAG: radical SAM protein [Candidatus Hermodarchaeota archaeon]
MVIEKIRVSIGSAAVLGLYQTEMFKDFPTTCYVMTYIKGHCIANCGFCPQARESKSSIEKLSRITWPIFPFKDFLTKLTYLPVKKRFKRICIQTLNYPNNFEDLIEIVSMIKKNVNIPISIAVPPMSREKLQDLKLKGVERVGIALDGASATIFEKVKGTGVNGPYKWEHHFKVLKEAIEIFSNGCVTTHIIIGLGESEKEVLELVEKLNTLQIRVSLFAFAPIKGTHLENLEPPELLIFRKLQLGWFLLMNNILDLENIIFNSKDEIIKFNLNKKELWNIIEGSNVFETSGCPGCNRPYYTSKPTGPIYNYPRKLSIAEKEEIFNQIMTYVN